MTDPITLRASAETVAASLPALLAQADQLASTVIMGEHGRRRAGMGDHFWQYRPAQTWDEARLIDWRRSGRSDTTYVQDKEWQIAQTVMMWIDRSASMSFSSADSHPTKAARAGVLMTALSLLLLRGGERVGVIGADIPARRGEAQSMRIAEWVAQADGSDYGSPDDAGILPNSRAVYMSDFMGDLAPLETALTRAADRGVSGTLFQILDPAEEDFPFDGRTVFQSMGGSLRFETQKAGDLRTRYRERLAERKDRIAALARTAGWQYGTHHTGDSAQSALLWLYTATEQTR
ncbi:hypothetical protein BVC71_09950 [Marivivens niveibacter]|uniref:DUF58 domain-containing protein n=1 Tax=Marivivens niveibacter TaxID=1930667 RepID=A0A251WXF6_9RHOB|nr:DUF58 domain-containing protein [Marivivens niveibacter]OUD09026.1 hypothetical protein BVC71_09950 [Marivivens niveibacter]